MGWRGLQEGEEVRGVRREEAEDGLLVVVAWAGADDAEGAKCNRECVLWSGTSVSRAQDRLTINCCNEPYVRC